MSGGSKSNILLGTVSENIDPMPLPTCLCRDDMFSEACLNLGNSLPCHTAPLTMSFLRGPVGELGIYGQWDVEMESMSGDSKGEDHKVRPQQL